MNKKNWLFLFLACTIAFTSLNSCKKSDDEDSTDDGPTEWTRSAVFGGDPRNQAATFTIDNQAFVVGGLLRTNTVLGDTWAFNGAAWEEIAAEFSGDARRSAVGFAVNGKGYVGLGYNGTTALKDFHRYDPTTQSWEKVADFPGEARFGAVAFALGNYAYVGLGMTPTDKTFSDFYKYDPSSDSWESVTNVPFTYKKSHAFAFVIGNKAYVGGGISNNQYPEEFHSFDGTNWVTLNPIRRDDSQYTYDLTRQNAATFAFGNYGYVVGGQKGSVLGNVWKYDPASDSWTDKHQALTSAGASARESAVGFSLNGKGYITTGGTSSSNSSRFDDTWEFTSAR
ncbi:Kelch repeat-containing protein [Sphingobacterium pedocola]|uniref:Galactose oxidase n=1 Tax=Sphingobacterium pedocola TaxID=2082722 RepID=A0ABR9TCN5_9SPHI|nr:kelch repeat-containing protein [Sphingobacterium pedocola]MBE8722824.1 hypothetical protein [Sphingobacterium pedocola]